MYKRDLALNGLQWLIYPKTEPTNNFKMLEYNILKFVNYRCWNLY